LTVLELIDKVCTYLCSKSLNEWTDLTEIAEVCSKSGLPEAKAESILSFLAKYFLEIDKSRRKARLIHSFHDLYRK